jgi:hypothetical protein
MHENINTGIHTANINEFNILVLSLDIITKRFCYKLTYIVYVHVGLVTPLSVIFQLYLTWWSVLLVNQTTD